MPTRCAFRPAEALALRLNIVLLVVDLVCFFICVRRFLYCSSYPWVGGQIRSTKTCKSHVSAKRNCKIILYALSQHKYYARCSNLSCFTIIITILQLGAFVKSDVGDGIPTFFIYWKFQFPSTGDQLLCLCFDLNTPQQIQFQIRRTKLQFAGIEICDA